jgi:hypothetical protein
MTGKTLEETVLATSPTDSHDLSGLVMSADLGADDAPALLDPAEAAPPLELISPETWAEQWSSLHDLMGGMLAMRTGNPCPLGDQARSEGGQIACRAAYGLLSSNPTIARLFLSPDSTMWGGVMAIGLHGFSCVQIVKASRSPQALQ